MAISNRQCLDNTKLHTERDLHRFQPRRADDDGRRTLYAFLQAGRNSNPPWTASAAQEASIGAFGFKSRDLTSGKDISLANLSLQQRPRDVYKEQE